jgi:hypothetical protein
MRLIGKEGFDVHRARRGSGAPDFIEVYTTDLDFESDGCDPYIREAVSCSSVISFDISDAYAEQAMLELLKTHEKV